MKSLIIFIFLIISFNGYSQSKPLTSNNFSKLYMIDSVFYPRGGTTEVYSDSLPNFLIVSEGKAVLTCYLVRNLGWGGFRSYSIFGEVDGFKQLYDKFGNEVIQFFIRGRQYDSGRIMSVEITEKTKGKIIIHYYNKFNGRDVYFSTHYANPQEANKVDSMFNNL